jgi:hypothetical protein
MLYAAGLAHFPPNGTDRKQNAANWILPWLARIVTSDYERNGTEQGAILSYDLTS